MEYVKRLFSRSRYGLILILVAVVGVRIDPLHRTSSGGYETNDFNKILVLIGWIGIAIVLVNLFRFLKQRAVKH